MKGWNYHLAEAQLNRVDRNSRPMENLKSQVDVTRRKGGLIVGPRDPDGIKDTDSQWKEGHYRKNTAAPPFVFARDTCFHSESHWARADPGRTGTKEKYCAFEGHSSHTVSHNVLQLEIY